MITNYQQTLKQLTEHVQETTLLQTAADALEWDERTGLPSAAGEYRADQVTLLRGLVHSRRTDPRLKELLFALRDWPEATDPLTDMGATVHRLIEDLERDEKRPQDLVKALANATMRGQQIWDEARRVGNFKLFKPVLDEIISLKRQAAACVVEPGQTLYDALLHEYEPHTKSSDLVTLFADLRNQLIALISDISSAQRFPDVDILRRQYSVDRQQATSRRAAELVGFDFERGRLDETSHPFCTNLGPDDCRILTRYYSDWFPSGLFGTLHEAGHGMYDQGLRREWYGLPPGSYVSLGIHESQSRMWENLVGRSRAFWEYFFPEVQRQFPETLEDVTLDAFHFALNAVQPSLIRVEADEATYNLHIIVRFELERALIAGDLQTADLPAAWNDSYESIVGITPDSDANGVLQDVHWSAGLFGYFPTYSLGNIYAAQLFDAAGRQLGDLNEMFRRGDFRPLLDWLRQNVHHYGRCLTPTEIVERACGEKPSSAALINSLRSRYAELFGF